MAQRYQVAIVGGGPVGVALGVELGQRKVSCVLVERNVKPQRIPKGQSLTNRTLEHFYFWNSLQQLRAARIMPPDYPIGGLSAYGSLMSEYWRIGGDFAERGPYYFQRNERLPQYLTEEVLRARLTELPSVKTLFGRTARSFEQDSNGVRVTVADDGWPYEEETLEADYLVGCDGARSLIRETLGIKRSGADFNQRMVLAVFHSTELHEGLKRFPERTTYSVIHPDLKGARYFLGRVEVGESWFFHSPVPADATADNYDFHDLVQRAAGFRFAATFEHIGFWDLRVAVADTYRQGRVFIAGDAAHVHPPYGGFGLNSGLEDVTNLGWKLAARLQGWGGERLLDSYTEERQPIFAETGEHQIAAGIRRTAAFADRYNPEQDRAEFESAWSGMGASEAGPPRPYDPHYEGSSVVDGAAGASIGIYGGRLSAATPGHHLNPVALSSGRNLYEELGTDFTLLALGDQDASIAAFEGAARSLRVPLTVVKDTCEDGRQGFEAQLVLVRPDQHIAWAGDQAPQDTSLLLRKLVGLP